MRTSFPLLFLAAALCLCLAGCDLFKTKAYDGKTPMSADEVAAAAKLDAEREKSKAKADADRLTAALKAEADEQAAKLQAEADEQATAQARRKAAFDKATAQLDAETRIKLAELAAEYETDTADARASLARSQAETTARLARMQTDTETAVAHIADRTSQALASIQQRADRASADLASKAEFGAWAQSTIGQVGGMVPGGGLVTSTLTGLIGIGLGRAGRKKLADEEYAAGKKDAHDERDLRDKEWDASHAAANNSALIATLLSASGIRLPQPTLPAPATAPASTGAAA